MTQSNALIQLQTALTTVLDTVVGVKVHDKWPETADVTYPIAVYGIGTSEDNDSCGAAAGDRTSNVRLTMDLIVDARSRLDALTLGDTIEKALDAELSFDEGDPVGKPIVSPVVVDIDAPTGYWKLTFEISQIIDNL